METSTLIVKMDIVRMVLTPVVIRRWKLDQLDVRNVLLNGNLEEEVYMNIPPRYKQKASITKLKKVLYGLRQSPREQLKKLRIVMVRQGHKQENWDHTIFVKKKEYKITFLLVYVNDIIIIGVDDQEIILLKRILTTKFNIKGLWNLKYFLGIEMQIWNEPHNQSGKVYFRSFKGNMKGMM